MLRSMDHKYFEPPLFGSPNPTTVKIPRIHEIWRCELEGWFLPKMNGGSILYASGFESFHNSTPQILWSAKLAKSRRGMINSPPILMNGRLGSTPDFEICEFSTQNKIQPNSSRVPYLWTPRYVDTWIFMPMARIHFRIWNFVSSTHLCLTPPNR
jgi:hypothetical protein